MLNNYVKDSTLEEESVTRLWLQLTEEVGELAGAIRRTSHQFQDSKKTNIDKEFVDILKCVFILAKKLDIDLDNAWGRYSPRYNKHT